MTEIAGRVAVVTGGASGIGRAIAQQLVERGAQVVVADIDDHALARVAREIGALGIPTDVADERSVQSLADATVGAFGSVGIVVNNAGVGMLKPLSETTLADWRRMIDINLWGVIHGVRVFLPHLEANPLGGHFVNTGSMASFVTDANLGAYAAAKHAVRALTETLALELADRSPGIGVTLLAPGTVRTAFGRQPGEPAPDPAALDAGMTAGTRAITAEQAAHVAVEAIENDWLYAPTHPEWVDMVESRAREIRDAFAR